MLCEQWNQSERSVSITFNILVIIFKGFSLLLRFSNVVVTCK